MRVDLAPALPSVLGDRVQVQQVIINLVINGIEAMTPVTDRTRELVIRSRPHDGNQVLVTVEDSGVGIEASCIATGGGSDAHVFQARGLPCLNVANGTERNHEPDERVTVEALETMLDVTLGIVARSA